MAQIAAVCFIDRFDRRTEPRSIIYVLNDSVCNSIAVIAVAAVCREIFLIIIYGLCLGVGLRPINGQKLRHARGIAVIDW